MRRGRSRAEEEVHIAEKPRKEGLGASHRKFGTEKIEEIALHPAAASWHGSCSEDHQVRAFAACAGPIRAGIAGSHPDLIPGPALA